MALLLLLLLPLPPLLLLPPLALLLLLLPALEAVKEPGDCLVAVPGRVLAGGRTSLVLSVRVGAGLKQPTRHLRDDATAAYM